FSPPPLVISPSPPSQFLHLHKFPSLQRTLLQSLLLLNRVDSLLFLTAERAKMGRSRSITEPDDDHFLDFLPISPGVYLTSLPFRDFSCCNQSVLPAVLHERPCCRSHRYKLNQKSCVLPTAPGLSV
ncbi:hypothetical protein PFISCL1PPCAC_24881, partial [Pristionchus fissidentatus]